MVIILIVLLCDNPARDHTTDYKELRDFIHVMDFAEDHWAVLKI